MAKDQTTKPQNKPASRTPLPATEAAAPVMEQVMTPATIAGQLANGSDTGLRQAALLQMQRQHGNQFVQRYLANRNGQSGGRTNGPAGLAELPFEEQLSDESGDGPRAFGPARTTPPSNAKTIRRATPHRKRKRSRRWPTPGPRWRRPARKKASPQEEGRRLPGTS